MTRLNRESIAAEPALARILSPRSIAFVGASASPVKVGGRRWLTMVAARFGGRLHAVHPNAREVAGIPAVRSLDEIPDPLDLVVVAIRPGAVLEVVEQAAELRVAGVVVITGGFGEQSAEGQALENRMRTRLNAVGARLIGPNCAGIFSAAGHVNVTGMMIPAGPIGLITQSGNVLLDVAHRARRSGIGLSHAISVGNAVDLRTPELLSTLLADANTKVVLVYQEGWLENEARMFCDIVRTSNFAKPVIILKPGDTEAGRRAVASHTGSLAGEARVAASAFHQAGILKASSIDGAWALAQALATAPPLRSGGIVVASDGGGHATLACDAVATVGLEVPTTSGAVKASLLTILPDRCPVSNPVDFAGYAEEEPSVVAETLDRCLADEAVGGALLAGHFGGYHRLAGDTIAAAELAAGERIGMIMRARRKPIVVHSVYADDGEPTVAVMRQLGVPVVRDLPAAAELLSGLRNWSRVAAGRPALPELWPDPAGVETVLARARSNVLLEPDARELLALYGLPNSPFTLVKTAKDCVSAVARFGVPVALKVVSDRVLHKSDLGGVILDVDVALAEDAFNHLQAVAKRAGDGAAAVIVAPMATRGIELVIGAFRDAHFGPVVMFGLGGILVEVLDDVAFRMAPLSAADASDLIDTVRGRKLLDGYRGAKRVDLEAVGAALVSVSRLIVSQERIVEVDINPLIASGSTLTVADARVILRA